MDLEQLVRQCEEEPIETPGLLQAAGGLLVVEIASGRIVAAGDNLADHLGISWNVAVGGLLDAVLPGPLAGRVAPLVRAASARPAATTGRARHADLQVVVTARDGLAFVEFEPVAGLTNLAAASDPFETYLDLLERSRSGASDSAPLEDYLGTVCAAFREFTGIDRVMAYQFHADGSGEIVAESRRDDLEPYLHLRYPASDIPRRARQLYRQMPLRVIPDVEACGVPLRTEGIEPTEVDLSTTSLRSPSPVHLQYLRNMGARASMVSSLIVEDQLWGMLACHHHKGPMRLPHAMRSAASLFTSSVASQIAGILRSAYHERLAVSRRTLHRAIESIAVLDEASDLFQSMLPTLQRVFAASGVTIRADDELMHQGDVPPRATIEAVEAMVPNDPLHEGVLAVERLAEAFPAHDQDSPIAGVLAVRLSSEAVVMVWREEVTETVRWAGRPQKAVHRAADGTARLLPRESFAEWREQHAGACEAWTQAERQLLDDFRSSMATLLVRQHEQLERLNRELRAKNTEMEAFVYSVSHDLKSPIVTLKSLLGILREDLEDGNGADALEMIGRLDRSAERMSRLIDEMLELSRVGKAIDALTPTSLNAVFERAMGAVGHLVAERGAIVQLQPDMPMVLGHALSLERLAENLLSNALKYGCPEPGMAVRVSASTRRRRVHLEVADDGPGIPPEHHRRIFALFQRFRSDVPGTGIGLALVEKIAMAHDGSAAVESSRGEGATFTVVLPAPPRAVPSRPAKPDAATTAKARAPSLPPEPA